MTWLGYVSLSNGTVRVEQHNETLPATADTPLFTAITPNLYPAIYSVNCAFSVTGTLKVKRTTAGATSDEYLNSGNNLESNTLYTFSVISGQNDSISLVYSATSGNVLALYVVESKGGAGVAPSQGAGSIDISTGDVEIGAVEIKDATTDTRAVVGSNGLAVDVKASALPSGAATESTLGDCKTALQVMDDWDSSDRCKTISQCEYVTKTATIANGASLSGEFDIEGYKHITLVFPTMTAGTTTCTFQVSPTSGGTFVELNNSALSEVSIGNGTTLISALAVAMDLPALQVAACRYLKIRTGTAASAVAQGATRDITILLKG